MIYSEIFKSIQGEGLYTGELSLWYRSFTCNLTCAGFNQPDPTDKISYHPVGESVSLIDVTDITELPVFKYGCDSAYSVSQKFKHLQREETAEEVAGRLAELLPVAGVWVNDDYNFHMVFTGGEPLMRGSQSDLVKLFDVWNNSPSGERPTHITFESNGTQKINSELQKRLEYPWVEEVLLSYSPKLFTVSGETNRAAIKPENLKHNIEILGDKVKYSLKFVVNQDDRCWDELEDIIQQIGLSKKSVWIMPVGGRIEDQEITAGDIADRAINKGYKVSARVHNYLWANQVGK